MTTPRCPAEDTFDKRVAVIGGTFSGNKGAAGMLESAIFNLGDRLPGRIRFDVFSVYPRRDRSRNLPPEVRIVGAPPLVLAAVLPPAALLYAILGALGLPRRFLLVVKPLRAIVEADLLLDVSGISFVDGRFAALLYNLASNVPALLVGTPLVKMSQALGPFRSFANKAAARIVLPRVRRIFARGTETEAHLASLGLRNVSAAADLAFILNDRVPLPAVPAGVLPAGEPGDVLIGVCPSEVLDRACKARGADLAGVLAAALDGIIEETGGRVAIIAHSLLEPEKRSHTNDYHVCVRVRDRMVRGDRASLVLTDLTPSELRAVIARCDCLVAARFHSMISALCVGVPPIVLAWSHKYREVMSDFGLERFVIERGEISAERIAAGVRTALSERETIRRRIDEAFAAVAGSARRQIDYAAGLLSKTRASMRAGALARNLYARFYEGRFLGARIGYASDPATRARAASGGLVTALLAEELRSGRAAGAIACRAGVENGAIALQTVFCTTPDEVASCSTSVYSDFNHARGVLAVLEGGGGPYAIVALPCQWSALNRALEKHAVLRSRVGLRIGLWCGHATDRRLIEDFLRSRGVRLADVRRLWYRRGLWRGTTLIELSSGGEQRIPFATGYGLLQNLYVDCKTRCFTCPDHFALGADVSVGDAWLGGLRHSPVKPSIALALTKRGSEALDSLVAAGAAYLEEIPPDVAVEAQKRAVIWHTFGAAGRERVAPLFRLALASRADVRPRWNDYCSALLILGAYRAYGSPLRPLLMKLPWPLSYPYMLLQKALLNF